MTDPASVLRAKARWRWPETLFWLAALACAQWNDYPTAYCDMHFAALKQILDQEEPEYTT